MALNATILAANILARFQALYRLEPPDDQLNNDDYFLIQFTRIISEEVVQHFITHAQCNGLDSHGDSHAGVGII